MASTHYPVVGKLGAGLRDRLRRLACNRSIRLTSEGTRFLLFTFAVGIAAVNTGNNLFYLLLAMMLSLIVISGLLSEQCVKHLEFRRHLPEYIVARSPTTVTLSVTNRKPRLPSFSLHLCDFVDGQDLDRDVFLHHLPPGASLLCTYHLMVPQRGWYRLHGVRVLTPFPFGLFVKKALYPFEDRLLVGPAIEPLPPLLVQELLALGQVPAASRRGPGTALYNLREYRPGDDSRSIHWLTTARTSKLIVKETEAEDQRLVTIVLSTVAPAEADEAFERGVSWAASLVAAFEEQGYLIRLLIGHEDTGFGTGERHRTVLCHALALCSRQDPAHADTVEYALQASLAANAEQSMTILILPCSTPQLQDIADSADVTLNVADEMRPWHAVPHSVSV